MAEEESEFDPRQFMNMLRKSASVKTGAVIFGEAQVAYYDTLKEHMGEEQAFNLLAHTTEMILHALADAAGPLADVVLRASIAWGQPPTATDKEVPGGSS